MMLLLIIVLSVAAMYALQKKLGVIPRTVGLATMKATP
jgi:hypothetical protein